MKISKHTYFLIMILLFSWSLKVFGQSDGKKYVREGNKLYKEDKFNAAEKQYHKAIEKQAKSYTGTFNLGDAYYKQGKYKEAAEQFEMLTTHKTGKDSLSKVYHNLGNSYLKQKEYEKSINAYKKALLQNPHNQDSRYNLAYAQKMLAQQKQQQKKNQDKNDKDNKNNKQNKNNKKNKDDKNKKDKEDNKNNNNKQDNKKQQQQGISKDNAQRLLDAMDNDEKSLRDKMNEKKVNVPKTHIDKNW